MLTQETKRKIDSARDILVGKVPDPKAQVEQITTALIYKFMDDMDKDAVEMGGAERFFSNGYEKYAWTKVMDSRLSGHERLNLYTEALTKLAHNPHIPQLFRDIFKDAFLPYRNPETLGLFLKEVNGFTYKHSEDLGDAFEYLLSIMGSQGDAGQFRTPRHIIDFIVAVVDPKKDETICDPACGTAGFLISAYKHIIRENDGVDEKGIANTERPLSPDEKSKMMNNLTGYDISPDMVRLSKVNMYLHGFADPKIYEYDTLSSEEKWDQTFDVMLANPPFMTPKGGIKPHKRFGVQANRAEVLFVDYIKEHLHTNGRAGIIVPEGIISRIEVAYKNLRKALLEDGLFAVISLPQGVFNPYSPVKTSILFFENSLAKKAKDILFIKIANDGFDLGAQRKPIEKNDIPIVISILNDYKKTVSEGVGSMGNIDELVNHFDFDHSRVSIISKDKILASEDYSLAGDRYREVKSCNNQKYSYVKLGDLCSIKTGKKDVNQGNPEGKYPFFTCARENTFSDSYSFDAEALLIAGNGNVGHVQYYKGRFEAYQRTYVITEFKNTVLVRYLYHYLLANLKPVLEAQKLGNTMPYIKLGMLSNFKIPLPPVNIQKEIIEQIEVKQDAINHAKAIISDLERERLYFGRTLERLNYQHVNLGNIFEKSSEQINPQNKSGNAVYIGLENIESNSGHLIGKINTEMKSIKSIKSVFKKGDILYGKLRPNLNKVWCADRDGICSTDILVLRPRDYNTVNTKFYSIVLSGTGFNTEVLKGLKGAQLPRVSYEYLSSIKIPSVPKEFQEKIVEETNREEEVIIVNHRLIKAMENKIQGVLAGV